MVKKKTRSSTSLSVSDPVRIVFGRKTGELGVVCRHDPGTSFYWVNLDRHSADPVYSKVEYGPYAHYELSRQRKILG